MLEESGCSFGSQNGILKVMNGSNVVMEGYKKHGIYILKGNSITVLAAAEVAGNSTTVLWH